MKLIPFIALAAFLTACRTTVAPHAPSSVSRITYHGWTNSLRLTSGTAEVIVVPQIGRVMSFRLLDGTNVFWEDRALDGGEGDGSGKEWVNFGGDKTWPAPEAAWGKYTGYKQWMPPPGFDGMAHTATNRGDTIVLTSPVDRFYGIRVVREISLHGSEMTIRTEYERVIGGEAKVGIWVITQFREPERVIVPLAKNSIFTNGYFTFPGPAWPQLVRGRDSLTIRRDTASPHKMGCDGDRLIWVGPDAICEVESVRLTSGGREGPDCFPEYPDNGASAEVYTNPDPKKYIELELLGPLQVLKAGERMERTSRYRLMRKGKS
jgi:hypothetical protein